VIEQFTDRNIEGEKMLKRALCGAVLFSMIGAILAGCSGKVEGTYQGHATFLLVPMIWKLNVKDDGAIFDVGDRRPIRLNVIHDGDRLLMKDEAGLQLAFHVKNGGRTLECQQCAALKLPTVWEKEESGSTIAEKKPSNAAAKVDSVSCERMSRHMAFLLAKDFAKSMAPAMGQMTNAQLKETANDFYQGFAKSGEADDRSVAGCLKRDDIQLIQCRLNAAQQYDALVCPGKEKRAKS
jgi:hypothetical protein